MHRIKIIDNSCFHNHWPASKTNLNESLFESKGLLVFRGPTQLVFSAYMEDRLCLLITSHYYHQPVSLLAS